MSAITIGLVAATLAALVVHRIRHTNFTLLLKSRTGGPAPLDEKDSGNFAPRDESAKHRKQTVIVSPIQDLEDKMVVFLTVVFSLAAIHIISSQQYGAGEKELACGVLGMVIGFWFKAEKKL